MSAPIKHPPKLEHLKTSARWRTFWIGRKCEWRASRDFLCLAGCWWSIEYGGFREPREPQTLKMSSEHMFYWHFIEVCANLSSVIPAFKLLLTVWFPQKFRQLDHHFKSRKLSMFTQDLTLTLTLTPNHSLIIWFLEVCTKGSSALFMFVISLHLLCAVESCLIVDWPI